MKNKLEEMKNKLEQKEIENQNLLNRIINKENENAMLQREISKTNTNNEYKEINSNNNFNTVKLNDEIYELKNEIIEKNNKIQKLENDLNNLKSLNSQFIKQNTELKKNQVINYERGSRSITEEKISLDNLRKELKDKNLQIEQLIKENNILKNNNIINNNNLEKDEKENELYKNNMQIIKSDSNIIRKSLNNSGVNEIEKNKLYMEEIKELKMINESDMIQIKALKADIKELKEKLKKIETFSGQLKNYDEFISLLNKALFDYRPKKKEQKEALNKLVEVMNNHRI